MATFPNLRSHPEYNKKRKRNHLEVGLLRALFGPLSHARVAKAGKKRPLHARPQAHVDTPQVRRTDWVKACGGPKKPLGKLPENLRVGIIGGGSAGVRTAFEAVKAGCKVTLIEARHEVGGRARSVSMGNKNIGEEGCMRFPPSEGDLYDLSYAFGYGYIKDFPDPSFVPTLVCYAGKCELWDDPMKVPTGFETVTSGWNALVLEGFHINGRKFVSPTKMAEWLQSPKKAVRMKVQEAWQDYIDEFKDDTFRRGLEKIFRPCKGTPPGGKTWTTGDFDRFGKLGVGSGGFGAFFKQCFLTIMRFMPNLWDTDHASFVKISPGGSEPAGIRELWQSVLDWAEKRGLKTMLNTKATSVSKRKGPGHNLLYTVRVERTDDNPEVGKIEDLEFDELFCNLTNNVAKVDLELARTGPDQIFASATCEAIETVHMALSTKLFVKVPRSPYFDDPKFPRVLLTDGNLPQAYCLDYQDPENVVVLLVYAWEEYSERLQAEKDPNRLFEFLKKSAAEAVATSAYNNWADCLQPVGEIQLQHWQDDPTARGAFTFALPGQELHCATMFYDFEKKEGPGPYLIGDSFSFGGGWTEPGQETVFNCFSAMVKRRAGELYHPELAPVNLISSSTYRY